MKNTCFLTLLVVASLQAANLVVAASADPANSRRINLVAAGKANAEIVTSEQPARMVTLAASELQTYIEKMTGAKLAIVENPDATVPIKIYVGRSEHTDALGLETGDLPNGAYRIRSGDQWLALVGRDKDFEFKEPWPKSRAGMDSFWEQWDKLTGAKWGNSFATHLMKQYNKQLGIWAYDEAGSLNAVYGFLRGLGVEWYMPGKLGEIVPKRDSLQIAAIDKVVHPDFGLRYHHGTSFWTNDTEAVLWYLRQGLNGSSEEIGLGQSALAHGMADVHRRQEFQKAHPEYFALRGGKRATDIDQPCLSAEGLFQEHVRYLRFMFDRYDMPMISIFPEDGAVYCEDPQCVKKATPERGWAGSQSDYVWGYMNRVAQELYKTHPDKKMSALAYANYLLPPEKIETLSPNLVVGILIYRNYYLEKEKRAGIDDLLKVWREKMKPDAKIFVWSHYPFTAPGRPSYGIPLYMPHGISDNLRQLKGLSLGEIVEVQFDPKTMSGLHAPMFNHLNSFVTARLYWDADQDVDKLLAEYYERFYGAAAVPMKAFVDFCEANSFALVKDAQVIAQALALFGKAKAAVDPGSVPGQRVALLGEYLKPFAGLQERLERGRVNVPEVRLSEVKNAKVKIDGRLIESEWVNLNASGSLVDVETGASATQKTSFKMFWSADALYVGITCKENDVSRLPDKVTARDDRAVWDSDCVDLLIETSDHSFYQLAIGPRGGFADADRSSGINTDWNSGAEVATHVGKGYWSVEIRLPIAAPGHLDPLNNIVGAKPTPTLPWFFNVGRSTPQAEGPPELSAFSPTGKRSFANVEKFAELYIGIKPEQLEKSRKAASAAR